MTGEEIGGVLDLGRGRKTLRTRGSASRSFTELSHHSLIQYTLPGSGEIIPLLQIVPSKTDAERLLVSSPSYRRPRGRSSPAVRCGDGAVGCVTSYDSHGARLEPADAVAVFSAGYGIEHRAIPPTRYVGGSGRAPHGTNSPTLPEAAAVHPA